MKMSKNSVSGLLTSVVNVFNTIEFCKDISTCKFGYGFIARSEPKFRAPKATAKEWLERFGEDMPRVVKVTKVVNARVYDYEKNINKQLARQGNDKVGEFKSDGLNGYTWVVPNIIKRADKDGSLQLTLTFKSSDKTSFAPIYIVKDHFATDEEIEFITSHLYVAPNKSVKQTDMGIADDNIVMVRNYKFSNIVKVGKTKDVEDFWSSLC